MFARPGMFDDSDEDDSLPPSGRSSMTAGTSRPGSTGAYGRHSGGSGDRPRSGGDGDGGLGTAGALPSTESRRAVMERQRELERQKAAARRGMTGGVMAGGFTSSAGVRSPARDPQTTRSVPQFSQPRFDDDDDDDDDDMFASARMRGSRGRGAPMSSGGPRGAPRGGGFREAQPRHSPAGRGRRAFDDDGGPEDDDDDYESRLKPATMRSAVPRGGSGTGESDLAKAMALRHRHRSEGKGGDDGSAVKSSLEARGVASSFDPTEGRGFGSGGSGGGRAGVSGGAIDTSDMRAFLTTPTPKRHGVVECYITRNKSGMNKLYPVYQLYMKQGDKFLLAAKKRAKQKTSNYLISTDAKDLSRTGPSFVGKLRSNFVGTEFTVYDAGANPKDADEKGGPGAPSRQPRQELAIVNYASNVLGSRGPRKMKVCAPRVRDGKRIVFQPEGDDGEMLARLKAKDFSDMVYMINKPPRWNEQVGAYVLNFNGRVTMASVKNFQLVNPDDQETVLLQFGRVGKDSFTMDYQWPLCPLQAFGIALSSFDYKIACE